MTLVSTSLTEIPIGGPNDCQVALQIMPPCDGYVISDRWQQIVNNPDAKGPGAYCNGFRGKPLHYLCNALPTVAAPPAGLVMANVTLDDPFATTIHNNGVFPLGVIYPGIFKIQKAVPFYAVWSNMDPDPMRNWSALDFLMGDPSQCSDISFLWRWRDSSGVYVPWTNKNAAGAAMQIIPSPYNYYLEDGQAIGYNGVEVVSVAVVDGPSYGFRATVS